MKRLIIAAAGLALVLGIIVGGIGGNPFDGAASASTAAVSGRLISLGTQTGVPGNEGLAVFPLVDVSDCYQMRVMASAPQTTTGIGFAADFNTSPDGTKAIRAYVVSGIIGDAQSVVDGYSTTSGIIQTPQRYVGLLVANHDPSPTDITAWIWCVTSPTYAVGGIAELPALAGPAGTSGMGGATYAVLAGAAAGVLAFAVLATLRVRRRSS
jgi:hypothetical protein